MPDRAWLVLAAALPVPLLLRRAAPATWSLPGAAPLLALGTVAGAFPALAGRAGTLCTRAAAGALGAWWLLLAEAADGPPPAARRRPPTPRTAARGALAAIVTLARDRRCLGVWAAAAAVLPYLVRGRLLVVDIVAGDRLGGGRRRPPRRPRSGPRRGA